MKGIGLVLAGGGGKGAYQIGVWKYLHEYGLDQYIRGVSGTSVGALNAALFAVGNYENAEQLWLNIAPGQILSPRKFSPADILAWLGRIGGAGAVAAVLKGVPMVLGGVLSNATSLFATSFLAMLGRRYAFSRDGLLQLMQDGVDFSMLRESLYPCYATCLEIPQFQVRRFDLRDYSTEDAQTILLASSAIPLVFDAVSFDKDLYYDGGIPLVGDNVPIAPIYEMGVEYIVVIHLSQDTPVDRSAYPNAKVLEIIPSRDLGGPVDGTLDFTAKGAEWRIELGYQDAKKIFEPFVQIAQLQAIDRQIVQQALEKQKIIDSRHQELNRQMEEIRLEMASDGFDQLLN